MMHVFHALRCLKNKNDEIDKNRTFPFISEVHVAIRSDLDRNTMAYKLYEWLQTDDVKPIISECGFIPK